MAIPLLAETIGIEPDWAVDRQHAIEVIDLVLQEFGAVAFEFCVVRRPLQILVLDLDAMDPGDPNQELRERKTIIPDGEVLAADIDDFGIDEGPGLIHLDIDHPNRCPNLGGGDRPAAAESRLPVPEGVPQVVNHHPHGGRPWLGDRVAPGPEDGVPQEANAVNGHRGPAVEGGKAALISCLSLGITRQPSLRARSENISCFILRCYEFTLKILYKI